MQREMITNTIAQTHQLAREFALSLPSRTTIVCLSGDLGSGKTTFTQGVLHACGAPKPYTSPTFTIVKEYSATNRVFTKIYHIDAYRIGARDMVELGWHDMLAEDRVLIIVEWPERIAEIIPSDAQKITCAWIDADRRKYTIYNQ